MSFITGGEYQSIDCQSTSSLQSSASKFSFGTRNCLTVVVEFDAVSFLTANIPILDELYPPIDEWCSLIIPTSWSTALMMDAAHLSDTSCLNIDQLTASQRVPCNPPHRGASASHSRATVGNGNRILVEATSVVPSVCGSSLLSSTASAPLSSHDSSTSS